MNRFSRHLLSALLAVPLVSSTLHAQYAKPDIGSMNKPVEPYQADEVGVAENPGALLPRDAKFVDDEGKHVTIGSYLDQGRPLVLWLGYYECPMLCDQISAGMVRSLKNVTLDAGKEFAILNVSIDPNESAGLAAAKKKSYLNELGRPGDAAGWNLLTGSPEAITNLTQTVGYKYKKLTIDGTVQYAHPAVLMIVSPQGKVTRHLYPTGDGRVDFDPQTMRLSLIEASEGKIGSTLDHVLLTCLRYDSTTGKYTWIATNLMKAGGALTVLVMLAVFVPLWIKSSRKGGDDSELGGGTVTRPI